MGTEEWFLIISRFKLEWGECLILRVPWKAFLLLFVNFVGVHFAVGALGHWRCPQVPSSASPSALGLLGPLLPQRGPGLPSLSAATSPACQGTHSTAPAAWGWSLLIHLTGTFFRQDSGVPPHPLIISSFVWPTFLPASLPVLCGHGWLKREVSLWGRHEGGSSGTGRCVHIPPHQIWALLHAPSRSALPDWCSGLLLFYCLYVVVFQCFQKCFSSDLQSTLLLVH